MKNIFRFTILGSLLINSVCIAQTTAVTTAPNDGVNPLMHGKSLGDIHNVDLYTGTAGFSIPIYDYQVDGLNIGVALGYSGRGIKVDQMASSVGLGWSVNVGCSIDRIVNGLEDEVSLPSPTSTSSSKIKGSWVSGSGAYYHEFTKGKYDLFELNLLGRSFQFTVSLRQPGSIKVITNPKSEIEIAVGVKQYIASSGGYSYLYYPTSSVDGISNPIGQAFPGDVPFFKITDEFGNVFMFEPADNVLKPFNYSDGSTLNYWATQRWLVSSIQTYSGNNIFFEYEKKLVYDIPVETDEIVTERASSSTEYGTLTATKKNRTWTGQEYFIKKVSYPNGVKAHFLYCDGSYGPSICRCDVERGMMLDAIVIESGYDNNLTNRISYNMNYSYFHTPTSSDSRYKIDYTRGLGCSDYSIGTANFADMQAGLRLCLDSITRMGTDNLTSELYYKFDYNSVPLPKRYSPARDYYGYYNNKSIPATYCYNATSSTGTDVSSSTVPYHTSLLYTGVGPGAYCSFGTDKSPDITYKAAATLNGLINGLGGSLTVYYDDHVLSNVPGTYGSSTPSGLEGQYANDGLRVQTIVQNDGYNVDNRIKTKYIYDLGERFFWGGYYWYKENDALGRENKIYRNHFVTPHSYFNGSNHGYRKVSVEKLGYDNQLLSKDEYEFSGIMNFQNLAQSNLVYNPSGFTQYNTFFHPSRFDKYRMGLLLTQKHFDNLSSLRWEITNQYGESSYTGTMVFLNTSHQNFEESVAGPPELHVYYDFATRIMNLKQSTKKIYTSGPTRTEITQFNYDANDNLHHMTWTNSLGKTLSKNMTYLYNHFAYTPLQKLQQVMTESVWIKNPSDSSLLSASIKDRGTFPASLPLRLGLAGSLKTRSPIPSASVGGLPNLTLAIYSPTSVSSQLAESMKKDVEILVYDDRGNILETQTGGTNVFNANFWDTRLGKKTAEVQNCHYDDAAVTSFEGAFASTTTDENRGNWRFDPSSVVFSPYDGSSGTAAMTGNYVHCGIDVIESEILLKSGVSYILTFWATQAPNVYSGGVAGTPMALTLQKTVGDWGLYTAQIIGADEPLVIEPAIIATYPVVIGSCIDELRLHPTTAMMTTWTYTPLFGQNSVCDSRNNIVYTEYDVQGRQTTVRNINREVISHTQTVHQAD